MKSSSYRSALTRMAPVFVGPAVAVLSVLAAAGTASAAVAARAAGQVAQQHGTARPAATKVSWHRMPLLHGWVTARNARFDIANPEYAISDGMVYLNGGLRQPHSGSDTFGVLPRGYRPSHVLYFSMLAGSQGAAGVLQIDTNGSMHAYGGGAQTFASLAAVSFPVSQVTWHALPLRNGWHASTGNNTGRPSYAVKNKIVHLAGAVHQASGGTVTFGLLPRGAWPAHSLFITVYTSGGSTGTLRIDSNGVLQAYGSQAGAFTSLAGISFPDASFAWKKLALKNGWQPAQSSYGAGGPSYAVVGPIVYMTGAVRQASETNGVFASMPAAARPSHILPMITYTYGFTFGVLQLTPSQLNIGSNPYTNAQYFTSLAAISFPRTS